ncbi:MAG: hypothetical protein HY303_15190 [Candidatus Wallbacteria bacterium]|nr:hypothetical protein [Candidatus Wallbacteria bacterium]
MTATMHHSRGLALYLALTLLLLSPFQGLGTAQAQVGVKTVVFGTALGAAALFGLKAMLGPASAVGTLGGAGTGFATSIGRAAGGMMSGVSSLASSLATGAQSLFAGVGRMLSTGLSGATSIVTQPWFYIPAALIAGGLLVHHFYAKSKAGSGATASGHTIAKPLGFFDRMKIVLRTPGSLVRPLFAPAPYSGAYYNGMSNFYTGGAAPFGTNNMQNLGGFGATAAAAGAAPVSAIGEPMRAGIDVSQDNRASLQPAAPGDTAGLKAKLDEAEQARRSAYERLVEALRGRASDTAGAASDPVQAAIRDYKEAHRQAEALRQQLEGQ